MQPLDHSQRVPDPKNPDPSISLQEAFGLAAVRFAGTSNGGRGYTQGIKLRQILKAWIGNLPPTFRFNRAIALALVWLLTNDYTHFTDEFIHDTVEKLSRSCTQPA